LILQVAAGQPGVLEQADRAGDVGWLAEAGVGVDEGGQVSDPGDLRPRSATSLRVVSPMSGSARSPALASAAPEM
jgi:hypothetical protein